MANARSEACLARSSPSDIDKNIDSIYDTRGPMAGAGVVWGVKAGARDGKAVACNEIPEARLNATAHQPHFMNAAAQTQWIRDLSEADY